MSNTLRRIVIVSFLSAALGTLGCNALATAFFGSNGVTSVCTDELGNISIVISDGAPGGCTP